MSAGQSAPKVTKPVAAYLRLTVDRDGNKIGYDVQQAAIEKYAAYRGLTIGQWYRDKDVTAADRKVERAEYEQMLRDVEAGMWGGIVVWRLDRLVRLSYEFERCNRIMEDAGGVIIALDPTEIRTDTDIGRLFMRLLVMLAEMEIAGMKSRARGHRKAKAQAGASHAGGPRPFGFVGAVRNEEGRYMNVGRVGVDHVPEEAELLREAARRIAYEGWQWTDVLNDWSTRVPPVLGTTGVPFSLTTLQTILSSPRIAGLREYRDQDDDGNEVRLTSPAVWEPILDTATWEKVKSKIGKRAPSGPKHSYTLSGIAHCKTCGFPLNGRKRQIYKPDGTFKEATFTYYCKTGPNEKLRGRCGRLEVRQEPVDRLIKAFIVKRLSEESALLRALREKSDRSDDVLQEALRVVDYCKTKLAELMEQYTNEKLTQDEWMLAREGFATRQASAERDVARAMKSITVPEPIGSDWDDLAAWYDRLILTQQRSLIQLLIVSISVAPADQVPRLVSPIRGGTRFNPDRVQIVPRSLNQR